MLLLPPGKPRFSLSSCCHTNSLTYTLDITPPKYTDDGIFSILVPFFPHSGLVMVRRLPTLRLPVLPPPPGITRASVRDGDSSCRKGEEARYVRD